MEDNPLVSICIPNYNYGHYLKHCLESVLAQTYKNIEIIFRDNNSSDSSYEIALEYEKKFRRQGIYFSTGKNKRNVGSSKNTNLCLRDTEGDLFYVLASDDAIHPTFIERCVDIFRENQNISMVMTHREEIDERGNVMSSPPFYKHTCFIPGEAQAAVFMLAGIAIPSQRMTRRSLLAKGNRYRMSLQVAGDWLDNFIAACCGDVAYLTDPLCQYRVHSGNETNESERNLVGVFEHFQLVNVFKFIADSFDMTKPQARYEEAVAHLGDMCLRYAMKMLRCGERDAAGRYLALAPVFKPSVTHEALHRRLSNCLPLSGAAFDAALANLAAAYAFKRTVSYDPPEGWLPLDKNGRIVQAEKA